MSLTFREVLEDLAYAFRVLCLEEELDTALDEPFKKYCPVSKEVHFEAEEIVTFLKFKIKARPEAFMEVIDHMNCYEESNKAISALSIQENNSGIVKEEKKKVEIKTVENLVGVNPTVEKEEAKVPSNVHYEKEKEDQNNNSEKEACPLLKYGKCKHGWSGTKIDQGKICSYNHPKVCKRQEMYGRCYDKYCSKFHLRICREYMNTLNCGYGKENCKFFHPTRLKEPRLGHERKTTYSRQGIQTEFRNSRIFHEKNQSYNQSYYRQGYQMQHPFLEQKKQGTVLEFMEGQKKGQQEILRRLEQLEMLQSPQRI